MSRNRFAATRLRPAQAHDLWARSDEASAFTHPDHLAQLVDEVDWWGVERSGEIVAAWPLVRAVAGAEIAPPPFCYYVGPMLARDLRDDKYLRFWTAYTELFRTLLDALTEHYAAFRFSLPLGLKDIRPLEWWNADHPRPSSFAARPRYTARIDLCSFADESSLYQSFARDRRRHIKRWAETPPTIVHDVPESRILELHDEALRRSDSRSPISPERHAALRRMVRLAASGAGATLGVRPQGSENVEAAIVLIDGVSESNDVLCAASDAWRDQGLTAWTVWQGILRARTLGMRWFDFNGANSPGRAADKHLYGAQTDLYFNCRFGPA